MNPLANRLWSSILLSVGTVAATVAGIPAANAASLTDPIPAAQLQQLLDAEHEAGMPGVFAEVRDGRRTWRGAAGVADVDTNRPIRPYFQQRVGSITKTFVATTVLQLVGERRVTLDARISRYLPGVVPQDLGGQVTVRMLLNHTSGIGNYTDLFQTADDVEAWRDRTATMRELAAIGLAMPVTNAPGAAWSYSNTNYVLLGLLVERVTGRPYAAEISRRILRPLQLTGTYFPAPNPHIRGPHSEGYIPWTDGNLYDFSVYNPSVWASAGELISTTRDLNTFYRALLSGKLLKPAQLQQMKTTVPMNPEAPDSAGYGLGLYWLQTPCGRAWGHDGGVFGYITISLHTEDGDRQVGLADNMSHYSETGDHPIDIARAEFLLAALCGTGDEARLAAAPSFLLPRTPDVPSALVPR